MINRVLIRLKVVQVIYAYYQNGGQKTADADRELAQSIDSAYSLYKTLLFIPVAWARQIRKSVARQQRMNAPHISRREILLAENRLLAQMESNAELDAYVQSNDFDWLFESDWMQNTCSAILESEAMEEYIQNEKFDFDADKELVRKLYKEFIEESDDLDTLLEEQNIYWNGDKELIDSFVLKTIKAFDDGKVGEQPLKTEFKDDEDRQFAIDLLHYGLEMAKEREEVVAANCRRWDPSRLAFLDVIIIQVALAEMIRFPQIPLKVSINEYVELAKLLSTPASGSFVNGMLDTIVKDMTAQGRLNKEL
ncbi:MAG: transcription antitermination protein NusB [Bacteroidaceae bacterium]|nr:transcription antitermination protein NusB [Bacteroidaceae bacterium]